MPGASWTQPNFETQDGTSYKTALDNCIQASERLCRPFTPREMATPVMRVWVDAGYFFSAGSMTSIPATKTNLFVAPSSNPRIDRVVQTSRGTLSIVQGTEAASPVPPVIPSGKQPICRVALQTTTTAIYNSHISDERVGMALVNIDTVKGSVRLTSSSGSWTCPIGVSRIFVTACAGGGGSGTAEGGTASSGGGYGTFVIMASYTAVPGNVYSYYVGAGGAGGDVSTSDPGDAGGNTRIATLFTLTGGIGGRDGTAIKNDSAVFFRYNYVSGWAGTIMRAGDGGSGPFGIGGKGACARVTSAQLQYAGGNPIGYGAGGGGAIQMPTGTGARQSGTAGAQGVIILIW